MEGDWRPIDQAPAEADLQLGVLDGGVVHALVFPCRRAGAIWVNSASGRRVDIDPTHWRLWSEARP